MPFRLRGQNCLQHRFEDSLHARGLKYPHGFFGPLVKRRVSENEAHILGMRGQDLLHGRIEGAAGFAGRIEELDDGDRCIGRANDR